jgi:hypothetical protein
MRVFTLNLRSQPQIGLFYILITLNKSRYFYIVPYFSRKIKVNLKKIMSYMKIFTKRLDNFCGL